MLTLGGLLGSLLGDLATRWLGRTGVLRLAEILFAAGTAMVGVANGLSPLIIGR
jgi:predicted MFS family arabinose efflux permease